MFGDNWTPWTANITYLYINTVYVPHTKYNIEIMEFVNTTYFVKIYKNLNPLCHMIRMKLVHYSP